jgi:hypothetical protein
MVSRLSLPRHRNVILCIKPGDGHWGTVDAGVVEVAVACIVRRNQIWWEWVWWEREWDHDW